MHVLIVSAGLHEDLERLERIIVKDYKQEAKGHKEKLQQNHRVRKRMDEMQQIARKLVRCT
jgi:splicing factor 3A subunit 3